MNQVSWRRILQRAGSEFPGEGGGAVINMQERAPERTMQERPPERRGPVPVRPPQKAGGDLESELKRALDRAQKHQREERPAAPPGWDPIFIAEELPARRAPVPSRARPLVAPPAPTAIKRGGNGVRNVIAISLSVAVIGLAIQQIGAQWANSRDTAATEDDSIPDFQAATAMLHSGGVAAKSEQGRIIAEPEAAAPETPSLRPSVAEPQAAAPERDALFQEMEEAAQIFLSKEKARKETDKRVAARPAPAPATPVAAQANAISSSEEQSMLRRGRDLIERGHINGARMIFEHLASQQSALGAFAMAQTYDASFLKGLAVAGPGLEPDQKMAAQWYQRAAELSTRTASAR